MSCLISTFICSKCCTTFLVLLHSNLSQKIIHILSPLHSRNITEISLTHFTFLMFSSCCRWTNTGNHRYISQAPTHVNANSNIHGTISTTTCTDIKSSTCGISNPIQTHDISPLDFKGYQSESTIHNTCWLLRSNIPTSKNISKAGHQQ